MNNIVNFSYNGDSISLPVERVEEIISNEYTEDGDKKYRVELYYRKPTDNKIGFYTFPIIETRIEAQEVVNVFTKIWIDKLNELDNNAHNSKETNIDIE